MNYIIDSRTIHEEMCVKSKHADWIKSFISKHTLVPGVDYIQTKEGKKHVYLFTEGIYDKINSTSSDVSIDDLIVLSVPSGFRASSGKLYLPSHTLASMLGKTHGNLLRDMRKYMAKADECLSHASDLNCESEVYLRALREDFKPSTYINSKGREEVCYLLGANAVLSIASKYSIKVLSKLTYTYLKYHDTQELYLASVSTNPKARKVYIIENEDTGDLKIGVAKNPARRLKQLQTGSVGTLSVAFETPLCDNCFNIETRAHEHFKEHSVRGEWFSALDFNTAKAWVEQQNLTSKGD